MTERKIFVSNKSAVHNYQGAKEYGELVFVTEGRLNVLDTTNLVLAFQKAFKNSTENDFILLTGPLVVNAIACALFAHKHGRINLLLFKDLEYRPREILLGEL